MGGRSYWCQFCDRSFIERLQYDAHERACFVNRHERIIPANVTIPKRDKLDD